ncbi:MAG TPA: hypothetical protein P5186_27850, partial [Candidatus Paceibacterota bacterium]|nr:hypothetical protein [Verrucomicrobiota bacterium]HRY51866.1 hypothetical protein [Candidatus Paceibacterota bacterium]HSA03444.1 hypothetical protein [Candidatus Paceibacterota bacterium]
AYPEYREKVNNNEPVTLFVFLDSWSHFQHENEPVFLFDCSGNRHRKFHQESHPKVSYWELGLVQTFPFQTQNYWDP